MPRSMKKGPFVDEKLYRKVEKLDQMGRKEPIRTWARSCTIVPEFVGHTFQVHNGRAFQTVFVTEDQHVWAGGMLRDADGAVVAELTGGGGGHGMTVSPAGTDTVSSAPSGCTKTTTGSTTTTTELGFAKMRGFAARVPVS